MRVEEPTGGELVEFPKDPDTVEISIGRWRPREPSKCRHFHVELREDRMMIGNTRIRTIACQKCGEELDPFEVLWRYAATDDKIRRQIKAHEGLAEAWKWLWDNSGTLTIGRSSVRGSLKVNGKRRTRKAMATQRDGLASLIIGAVDALKQLKRWGG